MDKRVDQSPTVLQYVATFVEVMFVTACYWLVGVLPEDNHSKKGNAWARIHAYRWAAWHFRKYLKHSDDSFGRASLAWCYARLGMLEMTSRTRWIDRSGDTTASLTDFTQVSVQRLAMVVRGLMLNALEAGAGAKCMHSSTTLAMPRGRLTDVQERIARFLHELTGVLQNAEQFDDVFQLELSLFPLTNFEPLEETNRGTTSDAVANRGAEP